MSSAVDELQMKIEGMLQCWNCALFIKERDSEMGDVINELRGQGLCSFVFRCVPWIRSCRMKRKEIREKNEEKRKLRGMDVKEW